jgi:hypothetical protein
MTQHSRCVPRSGARAHVMLRGWGREPLPAAEAAGASDDTNRLICPPSGAAVCRIGSVKVCSYFPPHPSEIKET